MKRIMVLGLLGLSLMGFVGCSEQTKESIKETATKVETFEEEVSEEEDVEFNFKDYGLMLAYNNMDDMNVTISDIVDNSAKVMADGFFTPEESANYMAQLVEAMANKVKNFETEGIDVEVLLELVEELNN
ncbi:MAG: hypothetical protein ACRC28_18845 [Clostridium sp.]|uniref:hypothetical protein n=1 Tax=Clostridium sp. TaxID=1506 RepID=UPI003F30604D